MYSRICILLARTVPISSRTAFDPPFRSYLHLSAFCLLSISSLLFPPPPPPSSASLSRVSRSYDIEIYRASAAEDKNGGKFDVQDIIFTILLYFKVIYSDTRFKRLFARCTFFEDITSVFSKNLRSIKSQSDEEARGNEFRRNHSAMFRMTEIF